MAQHWDEPPEPAVPVQPQLAEHEPPAPPSQPTIIALDEALAEKSPSSDIDRVTAEPTDQGAEETDSRTPEDVRAESRSTKRRPGREFVVVTSDYELSVRPRGDEDERQLVRTPEDKGSENGANASVTRIEAEDLAAVDLLLQPRTVAWIRRSVRHTSGVTVRVPSGEWRGDRFFLFFDITNQSGRPYRIAEVNLIDDRTSSDHARVARLAGRAGDDSGLVGVVAHGERLQGIVRVADPAKLVGHPLTLVVSDKAGEIRVAVSDIRLEEHPSE